MAESEVAHAMHHIDLEREAADRTLHSFAITTRHDFINARMQRDGERILNLIEQGRHEEAQALMNTDNWSMEGQPKRKKRYRTSKQKTGKGKR